MTTVSTHLWFDDGARQAAEFYVSLLPGSRITGATDWPDGSPMARGDAMQVTLDLGGAPYTLLNGGPNFPLTEAVSIFVTVDGQDEVDRLWSALTADGGEEGQCGWLKDRWGLSWQIVPQQLGEVLGGSDREGAARAMQAMLAMRKIDVAALRAAYDGA